jgi:glucokinase
MNAHFGIDIGATFVKYGAIDGDGHILFADRAPTRGTEGKEAALAAITGCATELMRWASKSGHTPASIGVGSPGTINPRTHAIQPPSPNIPVIVGISFPDLFQKETGLPTIVDNDANCAAWGEYRFGAGRGIDNLICLTVGSGLGSGFIIDGRILSGSSGSGGELGHVTIDWQGEQCPCGNRGCLETYVSATALVRRAADAAQAHPDSILARHRDSATGGLTIGGLFAAAEQGDTGAQHILEESAFQFAIGLLTAVNVVDPEAIIIGGGAADADAAFGSNWLTAIADHMHRAAFSEAGRRLRVGRAVLGNDAGFIGAAALGAHALTELR